MSAYLRNLSGVETGVSCSLIIVLALLGLMSGVMIFKCNVAPDLRTMFTTSSCVL